MRVFAKCEFSQNANFRKMRIFAKCELSQNFRKKCEFCEFRMRKHIPGSEVSNCNMVAFTSKKQIRNDVERNRKAKRAIIPAMILKKMVKFAIFSKR